MPPSSLPSTGNHGLRVLGRTKVAAKKNQPADTGNTIPPPPTVAPPPAPSRQPKLRESYRRPKKTSEQLQQDRQQQATQDAAARAGRTVLLSPEALQQRHEAVVEAQSTAATYSATPAPPPAAADAAAADSPADSASDASSLAQQKQQKQQQQQQQRRRPPSSSQTLPSRANRAAMPPLLRRRQQQQQYQQQQELYMVDALNFLHCHPSTKQLMQQGRVDAARTHLHKLVRLYAEQRNSSSGSSSSDSSGGGLEVVLVYDAVSQPSGSGSSSGIQETALSNRVKQIWRPGFEADTVIIDYVRGMYQQHARAAAAGVPGWQQQRRSVTVFSNDQRIAWDVAEPVLLSSGDEASSSSSSSMDARLFSRSNKPLSDALTQLENQLQAGSSAWGQAAAAAGALPSRDHDTLAWAERVFQLQRNGSKQAQQQQRQRQWRQVDEVAAADNADDLHVTLSDAELLQAVHAAAMPAATADAPPPAATAAVAAAVPPPPLAETAPAATEQQGWIVPASSVELDAALSDDIDELFKF